MNDEPITRRSLTSPRTRRTDWTRVDQQTDADIAAAAADDPDAVPITGDAWFASARIVEPAGKQAISIRLDQDVLEWFRANSDRYQSKINAVPRAYMEHERARTGR